jgi:hypothetical protein
MKKPRVFWRGTTHPNQKRLCLLQTNLARTLLE